MDLSGLEQRVALAKMLNGGKGCHRVHFSGKHFMFYKPCECRQCRKRRDQENKEIDRMVFFLIGLPLLALVIFLARHKWQEIFSLISLIFS